MIDSGDETILINEILEAARLHAENLKADIANAKDRIEHIRLSALAQEAQNLYVDLKVFSTGLVYTHSPDAAAKQAISAYLKVDAAGSEFKSPYSPLNAFNQIPETD